MKAMMESVVRCVSSCVLASMIITACATDEETGDDTEDTSTTEDALSTSEHRAFNFFVNKGLTKVQSAGVIGNLMQESSVNPRASAAAPAAARAPVPPAPTTSRTR